MFNFFEDEDDLGIFERINDINHPSWGLRSKEFENYE